MKAAFDFKNKTFITSVIVFMAACLAGYNVIYRSNIEKSDGLKLKIEEAKKIKVLLESVKILQDKIDAYLIMKNETPEPSSFLSKVVDIANSCEIKAEDIKAGAVIADGPYKFLPCGISFTAPYEKLKLFLKKLESDKKYIRLESLVIAPAKAGAAGAKTAMVHVNMELAGFYTD